MTVYADVLMLVNFVADYFLILLSYRFLRKKIHLWRTLLSAMVGGVFSLYIFLPKTNFFVESAIHILMCAIMCLLATPFQSFKIFLRDVAVFFLVNFAYSGAMIALWLLFKPYGMVINNSVVYFNISPLFLVLFSVIGYFGVVLLRKFLKKPFSDNTYCSVTAFCEERTVTLSGIADTGNSVTDVFGFSEIFITEQVFADLLLGEQKNNPSRIRKIPCATITGENLLDGYRIDSAEVTFNNKKHSFKNPILAISPTKLHECQIIVNAESLI